MKRRLDLVVKQNEMVRFWSKVSFPRGGSGCWLWMAAKSVDGYGHFWSGQTVKRAHRVIYGRLVGDIPRGFQIDHLCRTRSCVNPAHLEVVTQRENARRGAAGLMGATRMLSKTHCPHGHSYNQENTMLGVKGNRKCRECARVRCRIAYAMRSKQK